MRNRFVTIATAVFCIAAPLIISAQQAITEETKPAPINIEKPLGKAADKASLRVLLSEFTTLKASFSQTITDMQGQELQQSKGLLLLKKPQKLRWVVLSPEESLLIADGKTVYNVDPFVEQVTLLDQSSLTKSNPLMLLITDEETQWEQVAVVQEKNSFTLMSLVPDSPISKLLLNFGENEKLLSIVSIDRQQQQNSLLFSDVEYDKGTDALDFTFTSDPTWVVDDQREQPSSR